MSRMNDGGGHHHEMQERARRERQEAKRRLRRERRGGTHARRLAPPECGCDPGHGKTCGVHAARAKGDRTADLFARGATWVNRGRAS